MFLPDWPTGSRGGRWRIVVLGGRGSYGKEQREV